jgi:hypothetical protein
MTTRTNDTVREQAVREQAVREQIRQCMSPLNLESVAEIAPSIGITSQMLDNSLVPVGLVKKASQCWRLAWRASGLQVLMVQARAHCLLLPPAAERLNGARGCALQQQMTFSVVPLVQPTHLSGCASVGSKPGRSRATEAREPQKGSS